ncbi:hypothetical protein GOP47_0009246 [Adiantum capillus-veneris]|uniref:Uncharacterized protein n=1 Tax=Adiantum capillus-veneris TaxID=13818 RepID=A0A9D4UWN0_ADICA|nr:hypothetical protein GOP47_0009246 [Adiantum capillus-veneris]
MRYWRLLKPQDSMDDSLVTTFESLQVPRSMMHLLRRSEDVSIGKGEQGLVSCEQCVQPVAKKSEYASFEGVMSFCDDESMCEEVVQMESLCDDVSDDIGFFDNLLSEASVEVFFSFTFDTSTLEDFTCEFFYRLLDEKVPLETVIDAPKNGNLLVQML